MKRGLKLLYEGKAKKVFYYNESSVLIQFKDDVTAFNGLKKDTIKRKGVINKKITSFLFAFIGEKGIKTHFIKEIDEDLILAKKLEIIPLEVIIRNYATGSFIKRYGIKNGLKFKSPLIEFSLKDDNLNDPLICENTILSLNIIDNDSLIKIKNISFKVNEILSKYFEKSGILLVDFKLEFGVYNGEILVGDEISPDTCRFWDKKTLKSFDKDVYRNDTGDLISAYEKILNIIELNNNGER